MADVSVEFGAQDVGLEKTLKNIQAEMTALQGKVKTTQMSSEDLDQTFRKLGQLGNLEKKLKAIGDESSGTSPKVDELGRDLKTMGDKGDSAGKKTELSLGKIGLAAGVAGAAVKAGMLAVDAAFAAVNGTINAFGSAITKAADFQQLETSFNVLIGNTTLAKNFLDDLSKFAASTPFTIPGLADVSKTLISFGVVSSDVIPIVSMLGDVAQGNEEKLKSLALAFGKIESQGKLTGEELNQMIDAGFNPLEDISIKTGKSMGELRKEMEKGAITSGMVRDAFTAATSEGGKFFGMTQKQGLTFNGVMSTMQDAVDDLYRRFGRPLIDALTPIIQKWSERISSIAPLFSEIGQAAANTVTFFSNLVDKTFNVDNAVKNISKSLSAISGGEYSAGIENLFLSMKVWAMESANEIYKRLAASFKTATEFAKSIFDPSGAFGKTVIDSFEYIGTKASVAIMRTLAKGFAGSSITEGIALSLNTAANDANIAANKIEDGFKGAGGRIAEQFIAAGKALPESFAKNYADVQPLFTDIKSTQDQIDANNYKIAASTNQITKSEEEAVAEAKAYFQEWKKSEDLKQQAIQRELEEKTIKQDALALELAIAEAKASGNKQEIEDLNTKKEWLESWKKAIASGMGEEQAAAFANNLAAAKINADNIKPPAFTTAKEDAQAMEAALGGSKTFLEAMGKIEKVKAVEEAKLDAKAARAEIEAFGQYMNVDLQNMAFADIAKKLGVRDLSLTGKEQLQAIIDFVGESKDKLAVNPIDSDAFNSTWQGIQDTITGKKTILPLEANTTTAEQQVATLANPKTVEVNADITKAEEQLAGLGGGVAVELDAEQSIENIRAQLKEGIELDIAAKSGTSGLLEQIKGFVEQIKIAVEKIEPKLPQVALAV